MSIARQMAALGRQMRLTVGRCIVNLVKDAEEFQLVQLNGLEGETHEDVERFGQYGFTSRPHAGAEGIMASVGGVRSNCVLIAVEDRRFRLKLEADGEVALYDDLGQKVWLKRDALRIESPLKIDIAAPEVTVTANQARVDADTTEITGNAKIVGDLEVAGKLMVAGESVLGEGAAQFVKLANDQPATKVKSL